MKTFFFDVDTQMDFMLPSGALYVPKAETILDRIAVLNHLGVTVISTVDAHSEDDPEFQQWPHHCVLGTLGQRKPSATLLDSRVVVPNSDVSWKIAHASQILLEKQTFDCFTNVNLTAILDHLVAERYVVYGVVTEICVKLAAFGLLKTGRRVELVTDAVRSLTDDAGAIFLAEFTASGGFLTTAAAIIGV
jgi:nicotinamidase/pyrazinamidase